MKDLFRAAGNIVRADINIGADGRAKGSGTVIFETAKDAQQAISKYLYSQLNALYFGSVMLNSCDQLCSMATIGMAVHLKFAR